MSSMLPPASSTAAFKFSQTWRVCASMSPMPAIVPSGRRAVIPEMKRMRPRASTMVAWEKWPDGWRIFDDVICCLGMRLLLMRERTSIRRATRLQHLRMRARFDLDENVSVLPIAAVEKLMGNAGFAPDRLPRLFLRLTHVAVIEGHLVPALRQRHDEVRQPMLVPWLTLAGLECDAPYAHQLVLEQDLVANRSQHAHRCSLPAIIPYQRRLPQGAQPPVDRG